MKSSKTAGEKNFYEMRGTYKHDIWIFCLPSLSQPAGFEYLCLSDSWLGWRWCWLDDLSLLKILQIHNGGYLPARWMSQMLDELEEYAYDDFNWFMKMWNMMWLLLVKHEWLNNELKVQVIFFRMWERTNLREVLLAHFSKLADLFYRKWVQK